MQSKLVSLLLGYDEEEKHAEAAEKEQTLLDNLHEISERAQRRAQNARKMRKNEKSGRKSRRCGQSDDPDGKMLQSGSGR